MNNNGQRFHNFSHNTTQTCIIGVVCNVSGLEVLFIANNNVIIVNVYFFISSPNTCRMWRFFYTHRQAHLCVCECECLVVTPLLFLQYFHTHCSFIIFTRWNMQVGQGRPNETINFFCNKPLHCLENLINYGWNNMKLVILLPLNIMLPIIYCGY